MATLTVRSAEDMAEQRRRAERDIERYAWPARDRFDARKRGVAFLEALDIIERTPLEELPRVHRHYESEEERLRLYGGGGAVREDTIAITINYYIGRTDTQPFPF